MLALVEFPPAAKILIRIPGETAQPTRPPNHFMQTEPTKVSEELKQKAKVCETIARDKTQESLTGASSEKEQNEQEAKVWREKSKVWQEAEAIVRADPARPPTPADKNADQP